jgi:uncharacterized protein
MSPLDWICQLLAIDADAFNHRGTPEFVAISAVALRHNEISNTLLTAPDRFKPMHRREASGDIDARPWCQGFYAAMRLRISAWAPLLDASNPHHSLLQPILIHCCDDQGRLLLRPQSRKDGGPGDFSNTRLGIPAPSRRCASAGCRSATNAPADRCPCGSSYRLRSNVRACSMYCVSKSRDIAATPKGH